METAIGHNNKDEFQEFKIDLIVWKPVLILVPLTSLSWFKIDLIVWKRQCPNVLDHEPRGLKLT